MSDKRLSKSRAGKSFETGRTAKSRKVTVAEASGDMEPETGAGQRKGPDFSVVGIGASAGGYEAFLQLLSQLPKDSGMAFVLVQHLDPKHESKLSELLARSTDLPLQDAANGMSVQPNHIYVMPPNVDMSIHQGVFRFQPRKPHLTHMPVDYFLRSLAEDGGERAIGIVLSGTGTDGTLGLQAIKGEGGITFAQDEKSAKYFGMPGSAIGAGCAVLVLNPQAIARELDRIARHPYIGDAWKRKQPAKAKVETAESEKLFREKDEELHTVFSLLQARANVDFSLYKHSTLKRRIMRRMLLHKIETLPAYLNYLRTHLPEVDNLFNDLLINVTGFFRDPAVFQTLKRRIFPKLLKNRPHESPLRMWVCGCSSGEEAYSMAINLAEFFEATGSHTPVQIFATDISEPGLEKARAGIYPENIQMDVSVERLRRFFIKINGAYQVSKAIRDMCVFARQNMVIDPPFSNLDLISCRNVLIYLGQVLQKKIMPVFHYALKPEGYLLLGSSETIGASSDLFSLFDKRNKIYAKKTTPSRFAMSLIYKEPAERPEGSRLPTGAVKVEPRTPDLQQYVDRLILSKWSPAAVVVNAQMDVLLFRGRTGNFLEHAAGSASLNLLKMARESIALDLRTAISRALKQNTTVRHENVMVRQNGHNQMVTIEVMPFQLATSRERFFLILFQANRIAEGEPGRSGTRGPTSAKARQANERREMVNLRQELATGRESLQAIIEEQEATNEELKSANEEIQSSNEELQSTNEELETAKEELQSTNEELTTLNEELQTRNAELSQVNNDLTNLLANVNVAIIMLGTDLTIRRFTPMAERIFNLIPSDIGRRFTDLNRNINVPDLDQSIQQVVDNLTPVEREVQDREGRWYSLRIRPYRTRENKIEGAVMLLVDINEHKRAVESVMSIVKEPLITLEADLTVKKASNAFYELFQVKPEETEHKYIYDLGNGQWNNPKLRTLLEDILSKQQVVDDFKVETEFPDLGRRVMRLSARSYSEDARGKKLILLAIKDITA